jgi:hypothetical protein
MRGSKSSSLNAKDESSKKSFSVGAEKESWDLAIPGRKM